MTNTDHQSKKPIRTILIKIVSVEFFSNDQQDENLVTQKADFAIYRIGIQWLLVVQLVMKLVRQTNPTT